MDGTHGIGAFSTPAVQPAAAQFATGAADALGLTNQSSSGPALDPATEQIDDAPSPSPAAIAADTKSLPANVRFAPSTAPHDHSYQPNFDRSA